MNSIVYYILLAIILIYRSMLIKLLLHYSLSIGLAISFTGKATSTNDASTVHGAYLSGELATHETLTKNHFYIQLNQEASSSTSGANRKSSG